MEKEAADKRLRLHTETRLIKAIARVFPEPRTPQDPAAIMRALAKGYDLTIGDEAQIRGISPNNQEGQRILMRFYDPEKEIHIKNKKWIKEYPVNVDSCKFGADVLIDILKIFGVFKGSESASQDVVIEIRKNSPMILKNEYFTIYLAPRIDDAKNYEHPADKV